MKKYLILFVSLVFTAFLLTDCKDDEQTNPNPDPVIEPDTTPYFPSTSSWNTISIDSLGWDAQKVSDLLSFMDDGKTRAFLVLINGKIVIEHYNGNDLLGKPFGEESFWYWASAAKTLTASLVGIAEKEERLSLNDRTSQYLGNGWTTIDKNKEDLITIRHQLAMTSGLDDGDDPYCTDRECLTYKADAGTRWAYHNAPYTLLDSVIQSALGGNFYPYFNNKLRDPLGMDGFWSYSGYNHIYSSTARSMARFGWCVLNNGKWKDEQVIPANFVDSMRTTSQGINPSYGFLWWLNGKEKHMLPGLQLRLNGSITPNAPADMYAAMGKNGQLINVVPSLNMVVVRMGDNPDISLVPSKFQDEMWEKLIEIIE